MIPMSLADIAGVVDGEVHGDPDLLVTGGAYVDSRAPEPAGLFVAVVGERVDGHDYAGDAHAVLGSRATTAPTVVVADPVVALGALARHVVDTIGARVLALTGSQGKTGTKDYLAHVLAGAGPTVATRGNHNNEIGVPLTVLEATADTRYLVVEMGARGVGHIADLCRIAPPEAAAVLNVGTAHLSEFGSREAIAQAKGEIVEALSAGGTAVLNADDDLVAAMASRTTARVFDFGRSATVSWGDVELDDLGRPTFVLAYAGSSHPVTLTQSGAHQVPNAAAAAALAIAIGLDPAVVAERLAGAQPASRWRMELHQRGDGLVVVNDAYNANPASMTAALDSLAQIGARRRGRTIAVLGEMLELGDDTRSAHVEVGRHAGEAGIDLLVTVGETAAGIAEGARGVAGWQGDAVLAAGRDEALAVVQQNAAADDVVLVKASRGAALEHVADGLLTEGEGGR
ncbi:UDP-N-acetylmuramoyl-tripeptide--D-alanyl-D-alanine ligase [Nocardioides coralli]|uniref:UDP-N-acetylmuramoyl-tripeptide--D-alanyl-D- alanine ligase n=1 Tax=Nocardioides coralli TaxID=2872154 RepID=UPI001CA3C02B|nr:UDP-N-acetylmuramoyl-tripeptide--D-alanyl-D-alanine ligase [Nocardioides coralli]QZY27963.1 UDP-N-acetylmuramoyl-tripeptide--D-alanyl-D-alanine ligase [Nocardioides coralli]